MDGWRTPANEGTFFQSTFGSWLVAEERAIQKLFQSAGMFRVL